jgi:hypothetical protein
MPLVEFKTYSRTLSRWPKLGLASLGPCLEGDRVHVPWNVAEELVAANVAFVVKVVAPAPTFRRRIDAVGASK